MVMLILVFRIISVIPTIHLSNLQITKDALYIIMMLEP